MTSPLRTHREALSGPAALEEIAARSGTRFDPRVASALIAVVLEDPAAAGVGDPAPAAVVPARAIAPGYRAAR